MAELPDFQRRQYAFAAHIRDPDTNPAPSAIEDRRMAIYRELFFNNLLKLVSNTFPVLQKIHAPARWRALVREFMVRHRARTPYFLEIPREFLAFLDDEYVPRPDDYPFVAELAHYEWVELALSIATDVDDLSGIDGDGDLLNGVPVKSTLAWPVSYRYPVHRISPDFLPASPGDEPTRLVVYRRADDELGFMELNPVTARLLEMVANNDGRTGRQLLRRLAGEIDWTDPEAMIRHGGQALHDLRVAGILLGARPQKSS